MGEKELIKKLSHLKQIKPREEWIVLVRQRLFEQEAQPMPAPLQKERFWDMLQGIGRFIRFMVKYAERPAIVIPLLALIVAGGAIGKGVLESLPGDTL